MFCSRLNHHERTALLILSGANHNDHSYIEDRKLIRKALGEVNWQEFLDKINPNTISIIAKNLRERGLLTASRSRAVSSHLKLYYRRNLLLKASLSELSSRLKSRKIDFILLKGFFLEARAYEGMRFFDDIDILIRDKDLASARRCLSESGYRRTNAWITPELALIKQQEMFANKSGRSAVELHRNIVQSYAPFRMTQALLFKNSCFISIDGTRVRVLNNETALVHLCIHSCYSHPFPFASSLQHAYEISEFVSRNRIDWDVLTGITKASGSGAAVHEALRMTARLYNPRLDEKACFMIKNASSRKDRMLIRSFLFLMRRGPYWYLNSLHWIMRALLCDNLQGVKSLLKDLVGSAKMRLKIKPHMKE